MFINSKFSVSSFCIKLNYTGLLKYIIFISIMYFKEILNIFIITDLNLYTCKSIFDDGRDIL